MSQPLQLGREQLQKLIESAFVLQRDESATALEAAVDTSAEASDDLPLAVTPAQLRALIGDLPAMIQKNEIDLEEAFDLIALHLQRSTEADGVAAGLIEGSDVLYHAATGLSRALYGMRVRPEATLFHGMISGGDAVVSAETSGDQRLDHMLCQLRGARSLVLMPIGNAGAVVGAWEVVAERGDAFSPEAVACCAEAAAVTTECLAAERWEPVVVEAEDIAAWAAAQQMHGSRRDFSQQQQPGSEGRATSDALLHAEVTEPIRQDLAESTTLAVTTANPVTGDGTPTSSAVTEQAVPADENLAAADGSGWLTRQWRTNRANIIILLATAIFLAAMGFELAAALGWTSGSEEWLGALGGISDSTLALVPPPVMPERTTGNPQALVWVGLSQGEYYCGGKEDGHGLGFTLRQRDAQLAHYESARGEPCP